MTSKRHYYGFSWTHGYGVTTGDGESFRAYGQIYRFETAKERDLWCEYGGDYESSRDYRESVKRSEIPHGNHVDDCCDCWLIHVTSVTGGDIFGHAVSHCDPAGCNGGSNYWPNRCGHDLEKGDLALIDEMGDVERVEL